jgi:hypothetical protein
MDERAADAEAKLVQSVESEKKKGLGSNRGIETMFRSTYRVQLELTALADNKANMMTSINGIIISIILAAVAPKLDTNPWLLVPSTIMLLGTLISIVFSILAARPRINTAPITLGDLEHSEGNILFFGNFANLDKEHFTQGMLQLISDREVLYETMIHNIHDLGLVLKKKFALLKFAYNAFMAALIAGVLSFIAVFIWILQQAT